MIRVLIKRLKVKGIDKVIQSELANFGLLTKNFAIKSLLIKENSKENYLKACFQLFTPTNQGIDERIQNFANLLIRNEKEIKTGQQFFAILTKKSPIIVEYKKTKNQQYYLVLSLLVFNKTYIQSSIVYFVLLSFLKCLSFFAAQTCFPQFQGKLDARIEGL